MTTTAPVVLFVYNRPEHTLKTLTALAANTLASQTTLYIFSDGPKEDSAKDRVERTRKVIRQKQWCGEVIISESISNKGLGASISSGVTDIVKKHGRVIVLEDDIITSQGFLKYMNDALEVWKDEEKVMHISGYMYPIELPMPHTVFLNIVTPWGWATWDRAWKNYNDDAQDLLKKLENHPGFTQEKYNRGYGREFYDQLVANAEGRLHTWAVKWHTVIFLMNGACLHPGGSLTENIGFDGSGENCAVDENAVVMQLKRSVKVEKVPVIEYDDVLKAFRKYYIKRQPPRPSLFKIGMNFLKKIVNS